MRTRDRGSRGFTLIEVLIMILILGTIATAAIPMMSSWAEKAREAQTEANLREVDLATQRYEMNHKEPIGYVVDTSTDTLYDIFGDDGAGFWMQLTNPTDVNGNILGAEIDPNAASFIYGPYLTPMAKPASLLLGAPLDKEKHLAEGATKSIGDVQGLQVHHIITEADDGGWFVQHQIRAPRGTVVTGIPCDEVDEIKELIEALKASGALRLFLRGSSVTEVDVMRNTREHARKGSNRRFINLRGEEARTSLEAWFEEACREEGDTRSPRHAHSLTIPDRRQLQDLAEKIQVIKEVRAITGLGLKEAKDLVEGASPNVDTSRPWCGACESHRTLVPDVLVLLRDPNKCLRCHGSASTAPKPLPPLTIPYDREPPAAPIATPAPGDSAIVIEWTQPLPEGKK